MAKPRRIVDAHPEIGDHIRLLHEYNHPYREIAEMVSRVNGQRVSRSLVWRTIKASQCNRDKISELSQAKRDRECPSCHSHLIVELNNPEDPDRSVCGICGLVLERKIRFVIPKETQLESYMPSNRLNFSRLGQGNPTPLLIQAINSVNPQFKKRNGDYREFMLKLWELKAHLGIDDRLKKLKDRASKRLAELGFHKKRHYLISNEVGLVLDRFFAKYIRSLPEILQIKSYNLIVDTAIAIILESYYPENKCSQLQADFRLKSLMKQFLARKVVAQ